MAGSAEGPPSSGPAPAAIKPGSAEPIGLTDSATREILHALDRRQDTRVEALVNKLHVADQADLLEMVGPENRRILVDVLRPAFNPEVLPELDETVRDEVIDILSTAELAAAVTELESDDAVHLVEDLSEDDKKALLEAISETDREVVEEGLSYPESSAGRLMQRELVAVPASWHIGQIIDHLRSAADLPDEFYDIFVIDANRHPIGSVALSKAIRSQRAVIVQDIMNSELKLVPAEMDQEEVGYLFHQYDLVSAPVVDGNGRLVGVITVDDVVDVIEEEAEEDIMRLGGVSETDLHESLVTTTRRRFVWLLVNLGTAIIASVVIGLFDATIEQMVALAVLMPIVASMGGNAGTQTLTVAVRAIATKDLTATNALRVVNKEVLAGGVNGVLFAVLAGAVAYVWFGSLLLGLVIGAAMIFNMVVAALAGISIPLLLARVGIDPAIAAGVFLTTVTDVIGFFAFLGLAALVFL